MILGSYLNFYTFLTSSFYSLTYIMHSILREQIDVYFEVNCGEFPGRPGLGLCTSTVVSMGSIPGQGSKILHAVQHGQKKKIQV